MLRNFSLRVRYLISFLLILLPIALFLAILLYVNTGNNTRYINESTLEKFTYASTNIDTIIKQMDYAASTATGLESCLQTDENGRSAIPYETPVIAELERLEAKLLPSIKALFYLRGDDSIYTSAGRVPYSLYEKSVVGEYNLTMSGLYSGIMVAKDPVLKAILDPMLQRQMALAYILPFPRVADKPDAVLVFLLPSQLLASEFENYLGDLKGDVYVYTNKYKLLYSGLSEESELVPFAKLIKQKGVGVQPYGSSYISIMVSNSDTSLNCMLLTRKGSFYSDLYRMQRTFLLLGTLFVIMLAALFVWLMMFNYRPINQLVYDITGKRPRNRNVNELEMIRNYYDHTVEEVEKLSIHLSELSPLVTQQFVMQLIHGHVKTQDELIALARYVGVTLTRPWFAVIYMLLEGSAGQSEEQLQRVVQILSRVQLAGAGMALGALPEENATCMILNFNAKAGEEETQALSIAQSLCVLLDQGGSGHVRVGVGNYYADILRMEDSFAEASAAVQLAPQDGERVYGYVPHEPPAEASDGSITAVSPMASSLLAEAIHRGETDIAVRAVREITDQIGSVTESLIFFRFYSSNVVNLLLKQAKTEGVTLEPKLVESLISFKTKVEFDANAQALVSSLCAGIRQMQDQTSQQMKNQLMSYLLENYTRFDLSIQSVADALSMRRSQIASILKDSLGLTFVQYVSYLRMNEFKRLLLESSHTISELVNMIGYSDVPNFLRKFKAAEGVTAGQYRSMYARHELLP